MISSKSWLETLTRRLSDHYEHSEAKRIAFLFFQHLTQFSRTDLLLDKPILQLPEHWESLFNRLLLHEPIQYVLGQAPFYGRMFSVNPSVLIPRPETEELVQLVIRHIQSGGWPSPRLLDIGTGSGCIAISLAKELPLAYLEAWDVSADALQVAHQNARLLDAQVVFRRRNALMEEPSITPLFEAIVSNPPYVAQSERQQMKPNVLDFEPHLALFVTDDDPLVFYKKIAQIGQYQLTSNGFCCVEINEHFGPETVEVFVQSSYHPVHLISDIHGKNRFVLAYKQPSA
ncbi:MAG: peptide chain release factor N(5)-glutamine methyltransferase [Spirosomataceae bacterium]